MCPYSLPESPGSETKSVTKVDCGKLHKDKMKDKK